MKFHEIMVAFEDQQKVVMVNPLGSFAYRKMLMGFCNASQSFQKMINNRGLRNTFRYFFCFFLFCYAGSVIILKAVLTDKVRDRLALVKLKV